MGIPQNTTRGIAFMVMATLTYVIMDATAKALVGHYPALQVVWVRFAGQLLFSLLIVNRQARALFRTPDPGLHILRGLLQVGTILMFFAALAHISLAEATAIGDSGPVLITLGAALFLGERLGPRRIIAIMVALGGALVIIRPGAGAFTPWAVLPFLSAVFYAGYALLTRRLGRNESPWTAMLWGGLIGTGVTGLALPFIWVPIAPEDLAFFLAIGISGTMAQIFLITAFSTAEASAVASFAYLDIVFASTIGIAVYNEWPDRWTILGAATIAGAGLYVWHRERRPARVAVPDLPP